MFGLSVTETNYVETLRARADLAQREWRQFRFALRWKRLRNEAITADDIERRKQLENQAFECKVEAYEASVGPW